MVGRWYKEAIIYSLDVDTFKDGNGDGVGDFKGLAERCRYLSGLGVTCLWLLPFYTSPNRDNGYDVVDYYAVDPRLGTLGDFVEFMEEANDHKLRVMTDLVINHTSSEHPWFQQARSSRESPFHKFYIWRYDRPPDTSDEAIFPPKQKGIWTYEKQVDGWYFHRFYKHQPDLNIANPAVRAELKKIIAFWLKLGVSGFRVDAVPFLIEVIDDGNPDNRRVDLKFLDELREFIAWHKGDAVLLAEANVSREMQREYFGDGRRMQMVLNFLVNQHLFLSLARGSTEPLVQSLERMPKLPEHCQWGIFLRNHDELSLDRLTEEERQECFRQFGPEEEMRIFERGVRRRLAPMLGRDKRKILLAFSLLLSLPGTPVFWYGEELGMGEDLSLPERMSVRTPMHWSSEKNAGFSTAPAERLIRPVITDGDFSFKQVNVERAEREADSILNAIEHMIATRRHHPQFGCGAWRLLRTNQDGAVLAHECEWNGQRIAALHNFRDARLTVKLDVTDGESGIVSGTAADILGDQQRPIRDGQFEIDLEPFGYRWVALRDGDGMGRGEGNDR